MCLDNNPIAYLVTSTHLHMTVIPSDILASYEAVLIKRAIPASRHAAYKKWIRYYLDFCEKYPVPDSRSECPNEVGTDGFIVFIRDDSYD
jgi:hypothetical protein